MDVGGYNKKVIKHFQKPHNYGRIKNYDGLGKVGNPVCGDVIWLYIKIGRNQKKEEIIKDIKFETLGCAAAIATSSILTDLAKGKTLKDVFKIKSQDIVKGLGGLPSIKYHCSLLGVDALAEAVYDYFSKNKKEIPQFLKEIHKKLEKEKEEIEKRYKNE